jgi:hypothetical protein
MGPSKERVAVDKKPPVWTENTIRTRFDQGLEPAIIFAIQTGGPWQKDQNAENRAGKGPARSMKIIHHSQKHSSRI